MTSITELIDRQRATNNPPPPPEPTPEPPKRNDDLDRLIAEAKAYIENSWEDVDVVLGGEIVTVSVGMIAGSEWGDLVDYNPPEIRTDKPYGYNRSAVARAYPAHRIRLNGEPTDADTWAAVWDLLTGEDPINIQAVMWWNHIGKPTKTLEGRRPPTTTPTDTPEPEGPTE